MKLHQEQIEAYHKDGYLIMNNLFSESEIMQMKEDAESFENMKDLPSVICEKNGDVRSVFAPHLTSDSFDWLYRQERLIVPVQQLLENQVYLYQYKLNKKKAFGGDWWEWHQDFPFWHKDDGVKEPNMVSAMILFQNTKGIQGPIMFIPGSHRNGIATFEEKQHLKEKDDDLLNSLNADLKYTIDKNLLKNMAEQSEIVVGEGVIGTCIFFHPNLFHASNSNISPFDRYAAILTYNAVNNLPENRVNNRPEYICSRDFSPVELRSEKLIALVK